MKSPLLLDLCSGAVTVLALSAASACQKPPPPPAAPPPCDEVERIHVALAPSTNLNQDREGHPRSLQVRIYLLRSDAALQRTTFEELWHEDDRAVLGESLVSGPPEFTVIPGQPDALSLERHADAAWFGIAGRFREHNPGGAWKRLATLPAPVDPCRAPAAGGGRGPTIHVTLSDYGINAYVAGTGRTTDGR